MKRSSRETSTMTAWYTWAATEATTELSGLVATSQRTYPPEKRSFTWTGAPSKGPYSLKQSSNAVWRPTSLPRKALARL